MYSDISCLFLEQAPNEQNAFRANAGLTTLNKLMLVIGQSTASLPLVIPHKYVSQRDTCVCHQSVCLSVVRLFVRPSVCPSACHLSVTC